MLVKLVLPESTPARLRGMPDCAMMLWRRSWRAEIAQNLWRSTKSHLYTPAWCTTNAKLRVVTAQCERYDDVPHMRSSAAPDTWVSTAAVSNILDLDGSVCTLTFMDTPPDGLLPTSDPTQASIINAAHTARMSQTLPLKGSLVRGLPSDFLDRCEQRLPPLYGWREARPDELTALDIPVRLDDVCALKHIPRPDVRQLDLWDAVCWDLRHVCFLVS